MVNIHRINLTKILPQTTMEGYNIFIEELNNGKLKICYGAINRRGRPFKTTSIIVSKYIPISNLLFEGLGLWSGDGWKKGGLGFTNSEIRLIKKFIEFCKLLGINKGVFRWRLQLTRNPTDIKKVIKLYSEKIGLREDQFSGHSVYSVQRNFDCIMLYKTSKILLIIINALFKQAVPLLTTDVQVASSFLKGIFAADGWVRLRKGLNSVKHVGIAVKPLKFKEILNSVFNYLGINIQSDKNGLTISSREDFIKIRLLKLLELHPKKKEKFEKGLANFCYNYGENKYRTLHLLKSRGLSSDDLSRFIHITSRSARRIMQQLQMEGYVKYKRNGYKYIWSITDKGKIVLKENKDLVCLRLAYLRHKVRS
ncbi:MAG: winged helix-turn-helix transcriptional regulator [Candidatus Omnitrophica bacterium]|nr:winged helix-turn-helix transcriptional regulator [Candidatus Omnitrophota bacterium]